MRLAALLLLAALALAACAANRATEPADPVAQSRLLDEEIRKLRDETPVAREEQEIKAKIDESDRQRRDASRNLDHRLGDIYESQAWEDYQRKLADLRVKFGNEWEIERRALGEAAKRLYSSRHDELRRANQGPVLETSKLHFDVLNYPAVDGSTSTYPLNVIIAARILDVPYAWIYAEPTGVIWHRQPLLPPPPPKNQSPGGSVPGSIGGLLRRAGDLRDPVRTREEQEFKFTDARTFAQPGQSTAQQRKAVMINNLLATSTSTHDAFVRLIEGQCDINLSARAPSQAEQKLADEKKVKLILKPIAQDALVFIVNTQNPVKSLSLAQVRDIYEEKLKQWKEIGGGDKQILPLRREAESGSRELFDTLVMKGRQLPEPDVKWRYDVYALSMGGPFSRVTENPATLAYSVYYYEHFMAMSPMTRNLAIDGVEPTPETIASGKYPLVAPVYAVYRDDQPKDSPTVKLVEWLLSAEGQAVVRESGYVPVGP